MKPPRHKPYYTITQAARVLKITRAAVHRAIKAGRLEATEGEIIQVSKGWRISPKSLDHYCVSLLHQWVGKKNPLTVDSLYTVGLFCPKGYGKGGPGYVSGGAR